MLCGCGLLGVGIWLSVSQGSFATFSPSFPSLSAANMVIAIGAIVMVTGFLGCLGAIKENKCLLLSFFIVLLIILLAELILLILFFVYSDKVSENAKQDLKDGLALYNTDNNIGLRNAWNIIQAEWKCCGVTGYTDWHEALKEKVVPDRCCQEHYQECGRNSTNMFWTRGCYEKVEEWLEDNKHLLGTIGMCILVVQVFSLIIVAIGVYAKVQKATDAVRDTFFIDPAVILIVVGVVMFFITFCGCIGALRENIRLLKIFSFSLTLVFLTQMVIAILGFFYSDQTHDALGKFVKKAIVHYRDDLDLQNLMDYIQKE
ncbi:hypothetical protein cypCar_00034697, partial [Cyprinus carpio]